MAFAVLVCRTMGVRRFEDLVAWQLAHQLSLEIFAATETGPVSRDFRFREQVRDSAASAGRNIAEGFGRFSPGDFARFLRYARASLMETRNSLIEGRDKGYLKDPLAARLLNLTSATDRVTKSLMPSKLRQAASLPGRSGWREPT